MSFYNSVAHCFLVMKNISLSGCTIVYPFNSYRILVGYLQILAIMNKAATNVHVWTLTFKLL